MGGVSERARPGLHPVLRGATALAALTWRLCGLLVYWPWAAHRGRAAFRRALQAAGLPREAAARLAADYAAAGNPRRLLAAALRRR